MLGVLGEQNSEHAFISEDVVVLHPFMLFSSDVGKDDIGGLQIGIFFVAEILYEAFE